MVNMLPAPPPHLSIGGGMMGGGGPIVPYGGGGSMLPYGGGGPLARRGPTSMVRHIPKVYGTDGLNMMGGMGGGMGAASHVGGGGVGIKGASKFYRGMNRMMNPLSKSFNLMGRETTYGRAGLSAGLGMLALRNGANVVDRMRYGDYGGAMMSGALTAAAGYGAYASFMYKGSLRNHFNNSVKYALRGFR